MVDCKIPACESCKSQASIPTFRLCADHPLARIMGQGRCSVFRVENPKKHIEKFVLVS
jgi:hypothetical protein